MHIAIATIVLVIVGLAFFALGAIVAFLTISDLYRGHTNGPYAIGWHESPYVLGVCLASVLISLPLFWSAYRLWS
jgi:hypothetical protein